METKGPNKIGERLRSVFRRSKVAPLDSPSPSQTVVYLSDAPFPFLPVKRPSEISRPPSRSASDEQPKSSFFILPYELREQIYILAFGDRTIHVDLRFVERNTFGLATTGPNGEKALPPLYKWQWRSITCSRPVEAGVVDDKCIDRARKRHRKDKAKWNRAHSVGAMGWLGSCRRAYAEIVPILYSTNTFNIKTPELILNLRRLVLPQRVASMASLEILWGRSGCDCDEQSPMTSKLKCFVELMQKLGPASFPELRKLAITCTELHPMTLFGADHDHLPDLRIALLDPVDKLAEEFMAQGRRLELTISFPWPLWVSLVRLSDRESGRFTPGTAWPPKEGPGFDRFWRRIPRDGVGNIGDLEIEFDGDGLGYWVGKGSNNRYGPAHVPAGDDGGVSD